MEITGAAHKEVEIMTLSKIDAAVLDDCGVMKLENIGEEPHQKTGKNMSINIIRSNKFHNANTQYRADVDGFTLLRLTCGTSHGLRGGAIKTATVGDDRQGNRVWVCLVT